MTERETGLMWVFVRLCMCLYVCVCVCVRVCVRGDSKEASSNIQSQAFQEPWKSKEFPVENYRHCKPEKPTECTLIHRVTLGGSFVSEVTCYVI
jgi:hypothetical protein